MSSANVTLLCAVLFDWTALTLLYTCYLAGLAWLEAMTGGGAFAADYRPEEAATPPVARG